MNMHSLFDRDGYVKLAVKVGDKPSYQPQKTANMEEINFCLNCGKKKCRYGVCKDLPKKKEENDV